MFILVDNNHIILNTSCFALSTYYFADLVGRL